MNGNFKRNLFISSGISLLILIVSSTASFLSIRNLLESNAQVHQTQDMIFHLNEARAEALEAQTSLRGYLLTGKPNFLEAYNGSYTRVREKLNRVRQFSIGNIAQLRNLEKLDLVIDSYYEYLRQRVEEKSAGITVDHAVLKRGKYLLDKQRAQFLLIEAHEKQLLADRIAESNRQGRFSAILVVVAALMALIISAVFFYRILRDYRVRSRLQRALEESEESTRMRIQAISTIAGEISQGNYTVRVDDTQRDALGSVGLSLNSMAESLDKSFRQLSEKEWLQSGIAKLNDVMIGEQSPRELATSVIALVADYTRSSAGAIFLIEGDVLVPVAGYGYVPPKGMQIPLGHGLSGQAAKSNELMELVGSSPDDISITYAMGEVRPSHVIAIPLLDDRVAGVIELTTTRTYDNLDKEFLRSVAGNILISLRAAQNRQRVQELLEETQSQAEELSAQHSELESINAELEVQTEKLQASEEELRVQQEELQQTNEELAERSVLLEERNMEIQKKSEDLELTTRYKSEFLANMSHELRTPLNSILLLSRLLAENTDKNLTAEQTEFARVIQSSGNGLLGLIDEILDLSKIEAGKMDLELADLTVAGIAESLEPMFAPMAREKGIGFELVIDNAPHIIRTDKMRLEQILKNLISNAIKFTSTGSVKLEIAKNPDDAKKVDFTVTDTGIGIPPDKQLLIFEAFQQADGSTKRKYGGTGLGLSISRELAKLLRGEISLSSTVNKGSSFTLTLPVAGPGSVTESRKPEVSLQEEPEPVRYLNPAIPEDVPDDRDIIGENDRVMLIVEDDVNFAKSLVDFTRKRGYKAVATVRGDHAYNLAVAFKPVGILLDIELPVKNGWEVMEELKSSRQTRHIPVHIMSSHKVRQESLLKGAVNFLDKPAAFEQIPEVFARIEQIINKESKKVLIIEDNPKHARALSSFLESHNINSEISSEVSTGVEALRKEHVDCVILDMGIPDKQAYEILENVRQKEGLENLPVIVFTGKSLSMQEELRIKKYADSIVVKTAHSYQRMLDEVSLFLHIMEENKKGGKNKQARKQNMLNNVLNGKTVLIVDDDVRNIYSLTKALELLNMNVITAIDGKEALKALDQHPETDVVLLDMMMPNMDGYEAAGKIRQQPRFRNLPVIAVTAKAMTGDREKCISAGASDYITKPVDVDQLLSLLRVWLYDPS